MKGCGKIISGNRIVGLLKNKIQAFYINRIIVFDVLCKDGKILLLICLFYVELFPLTALSFSCLLPLMFDCQ